ncbi:MAG TPA: hypothetical protein VG477_07795, partial [Thermoanaerobaculia bacterium]|nr:hypothetical protein [Thermoanaerobaculia bacterium]
MKRLLPWLAAGLGVFARGVSLALLYLPEWRSGRPADPALFEREFRRIAAEAGFRLEPGSPRITLPTREMEDDYDALGEQAPGWLAGRRLAVNVQLSHPARLPGISVQQELIV